MQHSNGEPKTFPLRLPRSARAQARQIAEREGISINQFILLAVAENITRLEGFHSRGKYEPLPLSGDVNHTLPNGSAL